MKDNIKKSLKRLLKRKVKITLGIIIAFMITGVVSYSNDDVISESVTVKINSNGIYNEGVIESLENFEIIVGSNNGIYNNQGGTIGSLENFGIIVGNNGNGIYNYRGGQIISLANFGIIVGNNGNGIYNYRGEIKSLGNFGIIVGSNNGICNDSRTIGSLGNFGIIAGNNSNGIHNYKGEIKSLENFGIIAGNNGNGIHNSWGEIKSLGNFGIIAGNNGNGIDTALGGRIESLGNFGIIAGNNSNGIHNYKGEIKSLENFGIIAGNNGNGIHNSWGEIKSLGNFGIIAGNNGNGIDTALGGRIESLGNFGIIAGSTEAIKNRGTIINQKGLLINGAGTDNVTVNAGDGGTVDAEDGGEINNKFIINTVEKNEDYEKLKNEQAINIEKLNSKLNGNTNYKISDNSFKNLILNGYGTTLFVDGDLSLDNSIINGGVDGKSATIKGSNNIDNLTLTNGTIINGNIDLDKGNDNLTLDDKTQINGDLLGGDGEDTLTFNSNGVSTFSEDSEEKNINIFHSISEFENINIGTKVTLFEDAKVTGADNITIQENGNLVLRIDSTNRNSHALSGNKGTISSEGGKLLLALNGIGEGETINFGDTSLDETMKGNEEALKEITIDTTSLLHNIKKINANSVQVITVSDIPYVNNINYNQLNKIYQSMRITDQVKEFNITDDKTLTEFTKYLNDIYAGTPYSYSTEISRKTLTMFDEIAISKDLNPDLKSWAIYGGLTHIDGGNKNTFFGKGYYTYDVGSIDIDADTKIYGGYAKAEYGKSENFTTGLIFGGNNSEVSLSNGSKLEGDSFYFGVYGKQKFGNLKLTAGIGVQHGDYKADRKANGYSGITTTREFSENYHDRGFNIYLDGRYSYALGNNFFLEPRMTVDYNRIQQDEVSEKGVLGIEVDSKIFETSSGTVGLDIKKVIPTETLNHELTLGVSYNTFFSGDKEEYLTGRFVGGSNFDMLVGEKADTFSLNGKYEVSTEKGLSFDVRGNYAFEHENSKDEWTVGMGIGYKF